MRYLWNIDEREVISMGIGVKELLLILLVVLLVFGTGRLRSIGTDFGEAIKGFRRARGDEDNRLGLPADGGSARSGPNRDP